MMGLQRICRKLLVSFALCTGFAILMVLLLVLSHTTAYATPEEPIVVSFGDSYSAGEGNEPFYGQGANKYNSNDWLAHRSANSWPGQLVVTNAAGEQIELKDVKGSQWYFQAVSGALTEHVHETTQLKSYTALVGTDQYGYPLYENRQKYLPVQTDILQSENLAGKVDYVTITIGGNDLGFAEVLGEAARDVGGLLGGNFDAALDAAWNKYYTTTQYDLEETFQIIRDEVGDQAVIIVAGYPTLISEAGGGSRFLVTLFSSEEATKINESARQLNAEIGSLVTWAGDDKTVFVDVAKGFIGHEAYTADPYINEVYFSPRPEDLDQEPDGIADSLFGVSAYSMHPNAAGLEVYREAVQAKIDAMPIYVPVTDVTGVAAEVVAGEDLTLDGVVAPVNATNQAVTWSIKDAGATGAVVTGGVLTTTAAGTVVVTATIADGAAVGTDFTKDFTITVTEPIPPFIAVTNITGVPGEVVAGEDLALAGTVAPESATNQDIVWSVKDAGTTDAAIEGSTLTTTAAGSVVVTATIADGVAAGVPFTKDFTIVVTEPFIPVTNITDVPSEVVAGEDLTLAGTIAPVNATNREIVWSIKDAGTTGAIVFAGTLTTSLAGTVVVTATIADGAAVGTDFTKDFTITVTEPIPPFIAVTNITGVATETVAGEDLTLAGTVAPESATNQDIVWSVKDAGTTDAAIEGSTLATTAAGTVVVTATIADGVAAGVPFTKDFTIVVTEPFIPVTNITGVPDEVVAGEDLTLTGTVAPANATNQTVTWSVKDAGTTGATLSGTTLITSAAGTVVITATIADGVAAGVPFTKDFTIVATEPFIPVTNISGVPNEVVAGEELAITGIVAPTNATNQTVTWSIKNADTTGAVIDSSTLTTTAAGTVVVTATIADGVAVGTDFTKDFIITVTEPFVPVTDVAGVAAEVVAGENLTLTGTVAPEDATNQDIVWSLKDAGSTGAIVFAGTLTTSLAGTVVVTATIADGVAAGVPFTKDFTIVVTEPFVSVTNITDVPSEVVVGEDLALAGTVAPANAANQTISWSIKDAGTTGATLSGTTLITSAAGTVVVTATIADGTAVGIDFTKDFIITVTEPIPPFIPVTNITGVPGEVVAGEDLTLNGTIAPENATNQDIVWSVKDAGTTDAVIEGSTLATTAAGTVVVTATITDGAAAGVPFTKDFTITVTEPVPPFVPVTDIAGVATETVAGEDLTLAGIVAPANATNQAIVWSVKNAGSTDAAIEGSALTTTAAGTVVVTATIADGVAVGTDFTKDFTITVTEPIPPFVPVTDITGVAAETVAGEDLTLAGTVAPEDATNQALVWSLKDAGTTGAAIEGSTLATTAAGTVVVTATITDGAAAGVPFTKDFTIVVTEPFIPVTNISGVSSEVVAGEDLTLAGTVAPANATNQDIVWYLKDAGSTGAIVFAGTLTTSLAGTVVVTATIADGVAVGTDFTKDFTITVTEPIPPFVPVTDITGVAAETVAGEDLALAGTVAPEDATNQTVTWSVKDADSTGAAIEGSTLTTTAAGTVVITATITDGAAVGVDFTKDYTITVNAPPSIITDPSPDPAPDPAPDPTPDPIIVNPPAVNVDPGGESFVVVQQAEQSDDAPASTVNITTTTTSNNAGSDEADTKTITTDETPQSTGETDSSANQGNLLLWILFSIMALVTLGFAANIIVNKIKEGRAK